MTRRDRPTLIQLGGAKRSQTEDVAAKVVERARVRRCSVLQWRNSSGGFYTLSLGNTMGFGRTWCVPADVPENTTTGRKLA